MNFRLSSEQYLQKIGGWSAVLSGLFFGGMTLYLFGFLGSMGFKVGLFDDHTLLHPWVAAHKQFYRISWILFFLTQLFLIPVPYVLAHYFKTGNHKLQALAEFSKTFGTAAITIAVLCPVIFYASSPITAQAYLAAESTQAQELVLVMSSLMTDIPKEIRLFSEVILGIWLLLTGFLFHRSIRAKGLGWITFAIGFWTLAIVSVKIFEPGNPLEDFLGLVLAVNYVLIGMHLLSHSKTQTSLQRQAELSS
ncbi:DUF4386 family protein [Moorena producens]|uniref:DUF4386 family protein n=1 Tax=Moorena producens TaxID=1155739 RepID=UPI003C7482E9